MTTKSIETLVSDIYELFNPEVDHLVDEDNLEQFAQTMKEVLRSRLRKYTPPESPLRFSSLGKKDRQIWYQAHPDPSQPPEPMQPHTYFKFLYGDCIEALLLFLAKEAGHEVSHEQHTVTCDGVEGHIDAIIDGHVVDVKSASPYSFKKFEEGRVYEDDPFGYVYQLSGYATILTPGKPAYWLVADKVNGNLCTPKIDPPLINRHSPSERIGELREIISKETPPPRCYEDVPMGKSGNMKLDMGCSYCADKFRCWPEVRGFAYSTGPVYLTKVAREPDVPEFTR